MTSVRSLGEPPVTVDLRPCRVTISTSIGSISMVADPRLARRAVNNFLYLAREGFYDNLEFFRVVPHFIAQTGSPANDAAGGAGFTFAGELPRGYRYRQGDVALASTFAENGNSSQFFVCLGDLELGPDYPLLGHVVGDDGMVQKLNAVPVSADGRPAAPVVVRRVVVA